MRFHSITVLLTVAAACAAIGSDTHSSRKTVILEGRTARLIVDLGGGSITTFQMKAHELNPLKWGATGDTDEPRPMGHFLCLDRWGAPSESEQKNGMPFHGEAAHVVWESTGGVSRDSTWIRSEMSAALPIAGLSVKRSIRLAAAESLFQVKEEIRNDNKLGRIFNIVQHPTIGPPFLDESTLVDSNARKGFAQDAPVPSDSAGFKWPMARAGDRPVNLRYLTGDHSPNVVSFTVEDEFGWVTAANPLKGLLIGYIWKSAEYPWFNAWRHSENGKPVARGLEFGTTGLHQPFPTLVSKGTIFGKPLYEHIDSGQTITKSYACFLFRIPSDFRGVKQAGYKGNRLTLQERDSGVKRSLEMEVADLFPSGN